MKGNPKESQLNLILSLFFFFNLIDQDRHLDHLSEAIGRQKELGILISDELDLHAELLEQNEIAVDSTAGRMGTARRRLEDFRKSASSKSK